MTYRELAAKLNEFTDSQLDCSVTIVDMENTEGYGAELSFVDYSVTDEDFGLDDNHPFLYF